MVGVFGVVNLACDLGDRHDRLAKHADEQIADQERGTIDDRANNVRPAQSELGLVTVVAGNFLHEHHDPAPQGGSINSHERSDQP